MKMLLTKLFFPFVYLYSLAHNFRKSWWINKLNREQTDRLWQIKNQITDLMNEALKITGDNKKLNMVSAADGVRCSAETARVDLGAGSCRRLVFPQKWNDYYGNEVSLNVIVEINKQ